MTASSGSAADPLKRHGGIPLAWIRRWVREHTRALLIALLIALTLFAYAAPSMVAVVPPGHGGVLWRALAGGTVRGPALREGVHIIAPWDKVFLYDLRQHEETRTYSAIAGNGLSIDVDIGFIYHLRAETLGNLHQAVGPDYLEVLLMSQIGTVARDSIARWPADALYSRDRSKIETDIFNRLVDRANLNNIRASNKIVPTVPAPADAADDGQDDDYFELDSVMIREVTLPQQVQSAIQRKIEQQEMALEYQHRLARERLESERKAVEAEGIRKFQETVQQGISDTYLAWRGIEATLQLATSNNAKVVIIGNNANGLPLIFNTGQETGGGLSVTSGGTAAAHPASPDGGTASATTPLSAAATPSPTLPIPLRKPEKDAPPEAQPLPEQTHKVQENDQTLPTIPTEKDAAGENALLTIPYLGLTVPKPFH